MTTKKLIVTALCMALGVVLPMAFHAVPNAGSVLLPMHIPVLLCGLSTGPVYGLLCGIFTPILSSLLTGMPKVPYLFTMMFELAVYGLMAGVLIHFIKENKPVVNLYLSLAGAMLAGRVIYGIVNALIFQAGSYSFQLWLTASFVTAFPGIVLQLLLLPAVVRALQKTGMIE